MSELLAEFGFPPCFKPDVMAMEFTDRVLPPGPLIQTVAVVGVLTWRENAQCLQIIVDTSEDKCSVCICTLSARK